MKHKSTAITYAASWIKAIIRTIAHLTILRYSKEHDNNNCKIRNTLSSSTKSTNNPNHLEKILNSENVGPYDTHVNIRQLKCTKLLLPLAEFRSTQVKRSSVDRAFYDCDDKNYRSLLQVIFLQLFLKLQEQRIFNQLMCALVGSVNKFKNKLGIVNRDLKKDTQVKLSERI